MRPTRPRRGYPGRYGFSPKQQDGEFSICDNGAVARVRFVRIRSHLLDGKHPRLLGESSLIEAGGVVPIRRHFRVAGREADRPGDIVQHLGVNKSPVCMVAVVAVVGTPVPRTREMRPIDRPVFFLVR